MHVAPERVERKVWATQTTLALKDDAAWVQDTRDLRNANKCCIGAIWVAVRLVVRVHAKRVVVVALYILRRIIGKLMRRRIHNREIKWASSR